MITILTIFTINIILDFHERRIDNLKSTAKIIANSAEAAVAFGDSDLAMETLNNLKVRIHIQSAILYNADTSIFAQYSAIENQQIMSDFPLKSVKFKYFGNGYISVLEPILLNNELIGYVLLNSNIDELYERIEGFIYLIPLILMTIFLSSRYLLRMLNKSITEPILSLAQLTNSVTNSQKYSLRAKKISDDEIGLLSDNFNHMLEKMENLVDNLNFEKKNAEQANVSKSIFLSNMSHELRTPMHAILSFSSMGKQKIDTADKEKLLKYFTNIHLSGDRLLTLLNDILDLSKLESGKMDFNFSETKISHVLNLTISEINVLAKNKNVEINFIPPSFNDVLTIDSIRIGQVVLNLLSNAIKFTEPGGKIDITVKEDEMITGNRKTDTNTIPAVSISVIDNGVGIPEGELDTVFNKFIQSSKTITKAGGTGLGLSICKEIMNNHQGKIFAKNNKERGSTFTLIIPKYQSRIF